MELFVLGMREATEWAQGRHTFRVKARVRDYESWLTSANGDHRIEVQEQALGYLEGLRKALAVAK